MPTQKEVLTVEEMAHYLRIRPLTIYKHASGGRLPGFKVGSHWRFKKSTIDEWIRAQEVTNEALLKTQREDAMNIRLERIPRSDKIGQNKLEWT